MVDINFFTTTFYRHGMFTIPFIVSTLSNNTNSFAEVITDNKNIINSKVAACLNKFFKGRWVVYTLPARRFLNWHTINELSSIRFLTVPQKRTTYTYISDCDILFLDKDFYTNQIRHMRFLNKPYSNSVRNGQKRLTGLQLVKFNDYYHTLNTEYFDLVIKNINSKKLKFKSDEHLLYTMVKNKIGLPPPCYTNMNTTKPHSINYRPVPGLHMSLQRKAPYWGINKLRYKQYKELKQTEAWMEIQKFFPLKYAKMLSKFETHCKTHNI